MAAQANSSMAVDLPVSADEITQRVAVFRRFRELLIQQRDHFYRYLASQEKQQAAIESGNADELFAHIELEEQIVADIFSIQKVIDPLEVIYNADANVTVGSDASVGSDVSAAEDIPGIKAALEDLKNQAVKRSSHNRNLLSAHMDGIRNELTVLRNNSFSGTARPKYYHSGAASLVDIKG